jgi:hypothetical protein
MKVFTKIDEYFSAKPETSPSQPATKPGTKPSTTPEPSRPSPIRRDKPSVKPAPKAKAKQLVDRFLKELKKSNSSIEFDISKLKERYEE